MELRDVMRTTPATRDFTDEAMPDEVLHGILDVARFAPSGGNRQPWRVVVVRDPELRRGIRDAYVLGWREYVAHVRAGLVPFAPGPDRRWHGPAVDLAAARATPAPSDLADHLDEVPVMLVVCADLTGLAVLDNGLDRQSIVGGGSVYPFGHNILLAARDAGWGGVMTTAICREEQRVRDLLGIPDPWAVASLIVLGRPVMEITRLRRAPVDELVRIDRFDGDGLTLG
ncbi:MAG TPA: nitroreductase family protein [Acidimicrobiales bacterium]|nr:nitroreductase family protein [Acidimicrobiales bacterium]